MQSTDKTYMGLAKYLHFLIFLLLVACNGVPEEDVVENLNLADNSTLEINPSNKFLYVTETQQFIASGGNPPYKFTLDSGIGSVSQSGLYTAPASPGQAVVKVSDARGTSKEALIIIQVQVALSPTSRKLNVNASFQFETTGGTPPYLYTILSGNSSISSNGTFTGASDPEVARVRVTDQSGYYAEATVEVGHGPIISPTVGDVPVSSTYQFSASSGTAPFTWSVVAGEGSVDSTGLFTSSANSGTATVRVMDVNGFYSDATLTIFKRNKVAAGHLHTCVQNGNSNQVKCFGIKRYGTTGDGKFVVGDEPSDMGDNLVPVKFPSNVSAEPVILSMSRLNGCAIFTDGLTRCWGYSVHGQNGNNTNQTGTIAGTMEAYMLPVPADLSNPIVELARKNNSEAHQCGIYNDGTLKCWGRNTEGQLGQDNTTSYGANYTTASLYTANPINLGQTVTKVELGGYHTCAILNDGNVKCWGHNDLGQLGREDTNRIGDEAGEMALITALNFTNDITDLALGEKHTCVMDSQGQVFCWGRNDFGQLGLGHASHYSDGPAESPLALSPIPLGTGRKAISIDAGYHHTCALLDNSQVKCWGYNALGQLGQEDTFARGDQASELGNNLPAINLGVGLTAAEVYAGGHTTCVKLNTGKIKCWGYNDHGQLGLGIDFRLRQGDAVGEMGDNLPEVNLGSSVTDILQLSPFYPATCALVLEDGRNLVKCFGRNEDGQLGNEDQSQGDEPAELGANNPSLDLGTSKSIFDVYGGTYHNCALFTDGSSKCWGYNGNNVLGTNGANGTHVGSTAFDMGTALSYVITGSGVTISKFSFSKESYHGCAILGGGVLKCWGNNSNGQLGQNNYTYYSYIPTIPPLDLGAGRTPLDITTGHHHTCVLLDNGSVKCWGRNDLAQLGIGALGDKLTPMDVNLGTGVKGTQLCAGVHSTCVLTDAGKLKCWGHNTSGQLGQGHNHSPVGDDPAEMGDSLPYVNLGLGRTVKKLACGSYHKCTILDNNQVKCWGGGGSGQLGYGSTISIGLSASQMGDNLPYVKLGTGRTAIDIVAGSNHTCAVLDNNDVKCWGHNGYGQLGQGSLFNLGDQLGEMGDSLKPIELE